MLLYFMICVIAIFGAMQSGVYENPVYAIFFWLALMLNWMIGNYGPKKSKKG